ncbi:glycosyltransferase family 39 protein [Kutzneria sp. CA-103260]|uniref:glycosyltransferase family 39 protein n=1 Tax=Kutzneria sp. CA-103260 TaxID=2802641 RepID=UPI001BA8746E|nr:glycosyltransferase family 39 protein [Kutzneria sp. CA-103260]QUQ64662.1 Dolichyl-phosphate-mannose-protein mannosyltransferase [Kutzneria sp. CA-103260]
MVLQATLPARKPSPIDTARRQPARIEWRGVLAVAGAVALLLVALAARYGYYRDELYFRMLSDHPAWGYVDQPPLTPLLAGLGTHLFGDTAVGIRVPAALCAAAAVVLTAMIAAELGGSRRAQVVSALAAATSCYVLLVGHTLLTSSIDLVAWLAVALFVLRALVRGTGKWWLFAGVAVGISFYNKYLVVLLCLGLLAGLATVGPRRALVNRWLLGGVAIALVIGAPNLLYQAVHDWPQLKMASALSADGNGDRNRLFLLPGQLILVGLPLAPVWLAGLVGLFRRPEWRSARAVAVAYPVALVAIWVTGGRLDYAAPLVLVLLAAGCVHLDSWAFRRPRLITSALIVNATTSALLALPVLPESVLAQTPIPMANVEARDSTGWPELTRQVGAVVANLPSEQRNSAVLLAKDYGEAGALDRWRDDYHLPPVFSGHNELSTWMPPATATTVVSVGVPSDQLAPAFAQCSTIGTVQLGPDSVNQAQQEPIVVCTGRQSSWAQLWPRLAHLG